MRHAARQLPSWLIFDVGQMKSEQNELQLTLADIEGDLAAVGLAAAVTSFSGNAAYWDISLRVGERTFDLGRNFHDPIYCQESTPRRRSALIGSSAPAFADGGRCRRYLFGVVRYALEDPTFSAIEPPVI